MAILDGLVRSSTGTLLSKIKNQRSRWKWFFFAPGPQKVPMVLIKTTSTEIIFTPTRARVVVDKSGFIEKNKNKNEIRSCQIKGAAAPDISGNMRVKLRG
ncbi:MAG: hypothetical protein ACOCPQ_01670 [Desulfosudaceae bacterium]